MSVSTEIIPGSHAHAISLSLHGLEAWRTYRDKHLLPGLLVELYGQIDPFDTAGIKDYKTLLMNVCKILYCARISATFGSLEAMAVHVATAVSQLPDMHRHAFENHYHLVYRGLREACGADYVSDVQEHAFNMVKRLATMMVRPNIDTDPETIAAVAPIWFDLCDAALTVTVADIR